MDVKDNESAILAMNNLFYYAMNIPYDYVMYSLPWNDEVKKDWLPKFFGEIEWDCCVAHMIDKWNNAENHGGYYGKFFAFYAELDNTCRRKLLQYIIDNYDSGSKI